jgi:hypothetical protein
VPGDSTCEGSHGGFTRRRRAASELLTSAQPRDRDKHEPDAPDPTLDNVRYVSFWEWERSGRSTGVLHDDARIVGSGLPAQGLRSAGGRDASSSRVAGRIGHFAAVDLIVEDPREYGEVLWRVELELVEADPVSLR